LETSIGFLGVLAGLAWVAGCSSGSGEQAPAQGGGAGAAVGGATAGQSGAPGGGSALGGASGGVAGAGGSGGASAGAGMSSGAGMSASAGSSADGGTAGGGASGGGSGGAGGSGGSGGTNEALAKFSFFVTSYPAMKQLSGKAEGFGGDLRFGKADGLSGADEICKQVAELGMPGAGQKQWRAFLSVTQGPSGGAVHARDRIGTGPWHDALGRLIASDLNGLFAAARPAGDPEAVNDLPNELGQPNHYTGPNGLQTTVVDNHDTLTGSDTGGMLRATSAADTCNDWTSTTATGRPYIGHSWPRSANNGTQWASDHQVPGCAAGIDRTLGGSGDGSCIGCSGGYGGFYCFALP
jgi:hypothetical protein